eukprot:1569985-Amphidinium_carterae.3
MDPNAIIELPVDMHEQRDVSQEGEQEINPLAEPNDGRVLVCDVKVNFDHNADSRQNVIHEQHWRSAHQTSASAPSVTLSTLSSTLI